MLNRIIEFDEKCFTVVLFSFQPLSSTKRERVENEEKKNESWRHSKWIQLNSMNSFLVVVNMCVWLSVFKFVFFYPIHNNSTIFIFSIIRFHRSIDSTIALCIFLLWSSLFFSYKTMFAAHNAWNTSKSHGIIENNSTGKSLNMVKRWQQHSKRNRQQKVGTSSSEWTLA